MSETIPTEEEETPRDTSGETTVGRAWQTNPLVGLGGSAGAVQALQSFFRAMPADSGQSFVVVMHLLPGHESSLPEILQRCTSMPVHQVSADVRLAPNSVYVIPPGKLIKSLDGSLVVADDEPGGHGHRVTVDRFFRTLADTHGPHAAAIVLSGADGDGAIGIKRIKECGGLTVAQDPLEAEHGTMPRAAIATGMIDWVLPVSEMGPQLLRYFELGGQLNLPPEEPSVRVGRADAQEAALREVLGFLRARTGRDFSDYKRATVLRRIARRMQVNGVRELTEYLSCLRTRPGEAGALLQDLLISVTNFFRDPAAFHALAAHIPKLIEGKGHNDAVRIWVPACATGEEAYSIGILLCECTRGMEAPPLLQIFATDLDEQAIKIAREGMYPSTIQADVPEDRLRRYFSKEAGGYKVRRELREIILFAQHDLLKDSPFSRINLISCRNLLIYLKREAQQRLLETFHFALVPHGRLFLGASESVEDASSLFKVIDKKHRLFMQRPGRHAELPFVPDPGTLSLVDTQQREEGPVVPARNFQQVAGARVPVPATVRGVAWGQLHFKLLEALAPPSVLVDDQHDIRHLSPGAGRYLQYGGGEPSHSLLYAVHPSLRIELRSMLYQASQTRERAEVVVSPVEMGGQSRSITLRVEPVRDIGTELFLVTFDDRPSAHAPPPAAQPESASAGPVAHQLEREVERLKSHMRDTVEEYEASTEELKASNEELQAMNEELRSATEELETSREELQSINEELTTVNFELKSKVDELSHANSDIQNLIDATNIATIFLDRDMRISRYTPPAIRLFSLIATDVGRPLSDITTRLDYPELRSDAQQVLQRLAPIEREVGLPDGKWFLSRLLPYRTTDDRIAGVVVSFIDISERKHAEEVRRWLSAVVGSSNDAIISYAVDSTILSWNSGAERMFGFSAQEAIGQGMHILADGQTDDAQDILGRLRESEPVGNLETVRRRKDGSEIHVSLSISPIKDGQGKLIGATAIARDITEQKRAGEALRVAQERMRVLVENVTEYAIFSTDLDRRITSWNSGAERVLGFAETEAVGQNADWLFTEEDRAAHVPEKETQQALAEGRASDDRWHLRKDGSRFWASGSMMPIRDPQGRALGLVKILRDQTGARLAQEQLEQSRAELVRALEQNEQARAELQSADAAKDRFLAVLAHELRNPLASVDSAAALLLTHGLPDADRDPAALVIKRQAGAMKALLDDLLDVSRLKLGRLELRREPVRLAETIRAALASARPLVEAARHQLQVDLPADDIELEADPLRLGQVVSNLLTNAIKYTPPGGRIVVKACQQGDEAVISVADNGTGIDPAQIERIFDMYVQAQRPDGPDPGLGIGLALIRNIAELHGGKVEALSAGPGKGSEFRVTLPGARAVAAAPAAPAAPAVADSAERGLVLVADDNVDAGWAIARLLELSGYGTVVATSGKEALEEALHRKPDVGIIDIGMPEMNGHEVARRIRQQAWGQRMVLIAATGWGQESDERAALAAGFDAHMTKPVDVRKLVASVGQLLQRKRAQR